MRFTERAREAYERSTRAAGDALFDADHVQLDGVDARGWEATVRDRATGRSVAVILTPRSSPAGDEFQGACTCAAPKQPCAHQWAVLRELEALAEATTRLGRDAPCFRTDPLTGRVVGWCNTAARHSVLRATPSQGTPSSGAAAPAWARRLARLGAPGAEPEPTSPTGPAVATWLIDLEQTRRRDALALLPVRYSLGSSGPTSPERILKGNGLRAEDRAILSCLCGPDDAAMLPEDPTGLRPLIAGADLLPALIPLLKNAAVHPWDPHQSSSGPRQGLPQRLPPAIAWDTATPFGFAAVHGPAGDEDDEVRGELWRRAEVLRAQHVLALFGNGTYAVAQPSPDRATTIITVDVGRGDRLARSLLLEGPIRANTEERDDLLQRLVDVPGADRLESASIEWCPHDPVPLLQLVEPDPEATTPLLVGELRFAYGDGDVAADSPRTCVASGPPVHGRQRLARRRPPAEANARDHLTRAGGCWLDSGVPAVPRDGGDEVLQSLLDRGWRVRMGRADVVSSGTPRVRARRTDRIDWFQLDGHVPFGDQAVPLPELLAANVEPGLVTLDDGNLGLVPKGFREQFTSLARCAEKPRSLEFRGHQSWILDALQAIRPDLELTQDEGVQRASERLARLKSPAALPQPKGFRATLRDYQREGLGWMQYVGELGLGACLADDMGLGKTVQVLARIEQRRQARRARPGDVGAPTLVVAPRSLVGNWQREAARFAPELRVHLFTGSRRWVSDPEPSRLLAYDLVLTTYGALRQDAPRLRDVPWDMVVLDEAQAIKNPRSQSSKAVRLLQAQQRLALSGTPIENNLGELWSLFEFLNPGMLGRNEGFQGLLRRINDEGDEDAMAQIRAALEPLMLRRTKDSVLHELPPKTEQVLWCPMGTTQARQYEELARYYRSELLRAGQERGGASEPRNSVQVLEGLLRLRQAACHPALLNATRPNGTGEDGAQDCAKFEVLRPMLDELLAKGHKALIFSQFKSFLTLLREDLDRDSIPYAYLDGATADREGCVQRFQEDRNCGLFLISLRAGGAGLNLTAADYVFLLDPWWNPAAEAQAVDRAHRMGQTRPVVAYRMLCPSTIEEHIAAMQERKRGLADSILGGTSHRLKDMSTADLSRLLGGT